MTATSLLDMDQSTDTNAAIWKSEEGAQYWTAKTAEREQKRAAQWQFMGELLPFGEQDAFTFLDLGAGTGAAARGILELYPRSVAILTDFSSQMMGEGERQMQQFAGRFGYVEFDMSTSNWPAAIPATVDAVVTSMCIHHLPDLRRNVIDLCRLRQDFHRLGDLADLEDRVDTAFLIDLQLNAGFDVLLEAFGGAHARPSAPLPAHEAIAFGAPTEKTSNVCAPKDAQSREEAKQARRERRALERSKDPKPGHGPKGVQEAGDAGIPPAVVGKWRIVTKVMTCGGGV